MSKKLYLLLSLVLLASMVLAACAPAATATPTAAAVEPTTAPAEPTAAPVEPTAAPTAAPAEPTAAPAEPTAAPTDAPAASGGGEDLKVCQVTDVGGIDDKSFNQTAWKGVQDAMEQFGIEGKYLESQQQTDYEKNINAFIEEGCDLIIPVGFLLGDATKAAAEANPEQKFFGIDIVLDPILPNVVGTTFMVDQPSFLAGYLAAGVSKTGTVATYGGIKIPVLEPFMTGFVLGVRAYNEAKGTDVQVLGWDPATKEGLFAGNFESLDDGRRLGETLMDEGADVIYPVAGPVGLGTAAVIQERGNAWMVGVDTDLAVAQPQYADFMLTSVLKNMDKAVLAAVQTLVDDTFEGGNYVGTLENGGVGLAPLHADVPAELAAEVEELQQGIIDGTVTTLE